MERITHLWNVNQFITKLGCSQITNLQTFYIEKCRSLSAEVPLPAQNFGSSAMCMYCGSLWNTIDYNIRISRGRPLSKSIKKIVRSMKDNDKVIPKARRRLAQKCLQNQKNTLIFKCSVCSNSTKISLNKPQREKRQKSSSESAPSSQKRRKKRTKDKTAGLNISGLQNLSTGSVDESPTEKRVKKVRRNKNSITPNQKLKKLNINRLKDIVNKGATPQKRRSLHNFLTELC